MLQGGWEVVPIVSTKYMTRVILDVTYCMQYVKTHMIQANYGKHFVPGEQNVLFRNPDMWLLHVRCTRKPEPGIDSGLRRMPLTGVAFSPPPDY